MFAAAPLFALLTSTPTPTKKMMSPRRCCSSIVVSFMHVSSFFVILCVVPHLARAEPSSQCASGENGQCAPPRDGNDGTAEESSFVCRLYLAQSSIPNSGLGLFTGVPHNVGASVAPPEIAHQLLASFDGAEPQLQASSGYRDSLVKEYVWSSFVSGGSFEGSLVESLIPGVGMAANSFLPLVNARSIMGPIDSAGVGRTNGPGTGAFSAYYDTTYVAEMPLEAGSEVFADYGDNYFRGRPGEYGMVPLAPEFQRADEILKELWEALSPRLNNTPIGTEWQPLWDVMRNMVNDERTRNALPSSVSEIERAATRGAAYNFLRGDNPRTLDWLQSNGLCIDTLDVKPSSIPQAGRGTFAKRSFAAGETILPLPMIQIPRESLRIYKANPTDADAEDGHTAKFHSHQLLLNYCFGHKDSSLLLFPYSSTSSFVNHGGRDANAKVVWTNKETDITGFHKQDWMERSSGALLQEGRTGLMMMLVATRTIAKGEEVTIDYGPEWQSAWEEHVAEWSMRHDLSETHALTASELNESEDRIRTVFEDPYKSVGTACHFRHDSDEDVEEAGTRVDPGQEIDGHKALGFVYDKSYLERLRSNLSLIEERATVWRDHGGRSTISGDNFRPCKIIARKEGASSDEDRYTVRVFNSENGAGHSVMLPADREHYVKNVPRRAILFVDLPYTSSQQKYGAFRHEIGFPDGDDDLWPESWKDLQ